MRSKTEKVMAEFLGYPPSGLPLVEMCIGRKDKFYTRRVPHLRVKEPTQCQLDEAQYILKEYGVLAVRCYWCKACEKMARVIEAEDTSRCLLCGEGP